MVSNQSLALWTRILYLKPGGCRHFEDHGATEPFFPESVDHAVSVQFEQFNVQPVAKGVIALGNTQAAEVNVHRCFHDFPIHVFVGSRVAPHKVDHVQHGLAAALGDLSPEVRSEAAKGLGETKSPEAVTPLIEALHDEESDIRSEAAEALGHLPEERTIDALLAALGVGDRRVRISAIRALAIIGGGEVQARLFGEFCGPFDRETFPALVDALSG